MGRLLAVLPDYARNAWAGLAAPRLEGGGPTRIVQAVVRDGDRVLLAVRAELRGWELPGGRPDPGESDADALRREVREETGFEVEVGERVGEYHRSGFRPHVAVVYRAKLRGGVLTPSEETPVVRWWPVDALPETVFPWYRGPLEDAGDPAAGPRVRHEHQGIGAVLAGMRIDLRMRWQGDGEEEPG